LRLWLDTGAACRAGQARAVARGVKLGKPFALTLEQRQEAIVRLNAGESLRSIARTFGVSHHVIHFLGRSRQIWPKGTPRGENCQVKHAYFIAIARGGHFYRAGGTRW